MMNEHVDDVVYLMKKFLFNTSLFSVLASLG